MKKVLFIAALSFACLTANLANAQVGIHIGVNVGSQPDWGPVGYSHAEYYYMPDIDAYYDVPAHQYVYFENNVWIHNRALPARYHFDRYRTYKVVVNERNPWERHAQVRYRYATYRGHRDQQVIRDSRDEQYRNHWHGDEGDRHDNGNHYGQRRNGDQGHGNDHHDNRGHGHDHNDH